MDMLSVIASSRRRSTFTGLLDLYPGAAAAYSLRCLNSLFLNDWFVQVRRASDNDEVQVKYDQSIAIPRLSLNSPLVASGATFGDFVSGTDGFVPDWRDVSGNGRNATQATAGNQPQIVASGVVVTHPDASGKAGIRFLDASFAAVGRYLATSSAWHGVADAWVGAFSLYSMGSDGSLPVLFDDHNVASINRGLISYHSSTRQVLTATIRTGGSSVANGTAISRNTRYIRTDYANRTNIVTLLNGTSAISAADRNENFVASDKVWIGNVNSNSIQSDIYLSEMLFWNTDQSANESAIRGNMNTAWSVY